MISSPMPPARTGWPLGASTTARSQPSSGSPIRTGPRRRQLSRAGDHGGLGGTVGVPHLASGAGASRVAELRRAGLAAEDQQPDAGQRLERPQRATSVGTVETTVMSLATSHGPRSMPLRTSDRGAGTRQAPCAQASHISSQEASKRDRQAGHHPVADAERPVLAGTAVPRRRRTRPRNVTPHPSAYGRLTSVAA